MERSGMRVSLHAFVRGLLDQAILAFPTPNFREYERSSPLNTP
jgi:hypothetical protein